MGASVKVDTEKPADGEGIPVQRWGHNEGQLFIN